MHGKPGFEFSVVQLVYCSHAAMAGNRAGLERDLSDILDHSRACNPLHDITGALLTDGDMLAHVIEGPSAAVRSFHARIMRDKRHDRVLVLQHALVHVRLFGMWPLAFLRVGALSHARTLDARSTPAELRNASVSVLKACRPIFLR